ncbi:hypothetical protein [Streptomyces sp. NPDC052042]|uniref:hypothetical protein n=1 Tax=Streptomyces sp. NPDC052042 TaxID=3365683 RepID=UPI0037D2CF79
MIRPHPTSDEFRGFDEARRLMWSYEARSRVYERLSLTGFLADEAVMAVHVENTSRADRVSLTAFDQRGRRIGGDTLYVDDPTHHRLDVTPEFDHDFTRMRIPRGSDLDRAVAREDGWVIDMRVLREHDPIADRRNTQREVLLAHLADMMASGQVRGFLNGQPLDEETGEVDDEDDTDGPTSSGAA